MEWSSTNVKFSIVETSMIENESVVTDKYELEYRESQQI